MSSRKSRKKHILLAVKLVLALALLAWVFSSVPFRDYVRSSEGQDWPVLEQSIRDGQTVYTVNTGSIFSVQTRQVPADQLEPVSPDQPQRVVRPGFLTNLKTVNKLLLLVGLAGFAASIVCISIRWRSILKLQGVRISRWEALRLTFLGEFFSQVIPGTVGGDLVKAYYVSRHTHQRSGVLASVFVDRMMGLTGLAVLATVMTLVVLAVGLEDPQTIGKSFVAAVVLLGCVGLALMLMLSRRLRRWLRIGRILEKLPIAGHLDELREVVTRYRQHLGRFLVPAALTILAHTLWITGMMLIGLSLNLPTAWYRYFIYVPLIYIIGAVPITPGGVGLVEKLYLTFFAVDPAGVVALALLVRLMRIIVPLPGLLVALTGPKIPKVEDMEAQLGIEAETAE
ncbi:MAG: lysylphosphatidylglycerol synthase transmembrane domain-containing protein [Phycisphaerae bacterium]